MVQRVRGRSLAALVVLALSTALTAMVTVGVASSKVNATTGVDPSTTTVKIAVVGLDFQALVDAGVVPDLGKLVDQFKQLQNEINSGGQAGKYKLDVVVDLLPSQPTAEQYQAECLWATEEQHAFAVVLAPMGGEDLPRCIAIDHKTFVIGIVGYTDQLYKDAKGLVMTAGSNQAMSIDRQARAWAQVSASQKLLKGQKIGVVASDGNAAALKTIDAVLIPTLKQLGYNVTDTIVLPCADNPSTCSQQAVAVQKLKNDGVTFVFNAADVLAGETLVAEAQKIGYTPKWSANRNNTTDTVAKFFQPVADAWEGANGVSVTWPDSDFSPETKACNANAAKGGLFNYRPEQNAYAAYGSYCIVMELMAQAIKGVTGDLTTASFTKALVAIGTAPSNSGPPGTWAPGKYDSGDHAYAAKYSKAANAGKGGFMPVGGTAKPVKIAAKAGTTKSDSSK